MGYKNANPKEIWIRTRWKNYTLYVNCFFAKISCKPLIHLWLKSGVSPVFTNASSKKLVGREVSGPVSESWEVWHIQMLLRDISKVALCISPFPNATMKDYSQIRTYIPEKVHFLVKGHSEWKTDGKNIQINTPAHQQGLIREEGNAG